IILDRIEETAGKCFLVKIRLREYIESLSEDYKAYEIQREIVTNVYLDNLIQTILDKKHIPSLVLVCEKEDFVLNNADFTVMKFKILDGLQRTFRLKSIFDTINLFIDEYEQSANILNLSKLQLSKQYKDKLETFAGSAIHLSKISEHVKENNTQIPELKKLFERYQWFEIWTGLDDESEVEKMLVLNAGH